MIEIENITKSIQGKTVLEDVTLTVEKNRIMALVGPSGSGKTTLLRMIAGLSSPCSGVIRIDGIHASDSRFVLSPRKRKLAMIFQDLALWPHMTARKNLEYVVRRNRSNDKTVSDKIAGLLDAVGLNGHSERYPHQLSGGEQQRLAIVRAIAQEPDYLLMDEPFSSLDPILKEELQSFLFRLRKSSEIGIVYATHNFRDFEKITDHVSVMNSGRLVQTGNKNDVVNNPIDLFAKKILGA